MSKGRGKRGDGRRGERDAARTVSGVHRAPPSEKPPPSKRSPAPSPRLLHRWRVFAIAGAALATIVAGGITLYARRPTRDARSRVDFPAPRPTTRASRTTSRDFAGAEACASCHAEQYAKWKTSTHGTAGGAPGAVTVIAKFDGQPIRFKDAVVIPAAAGSGYAFTVKQPPHPDRVFRVDGVVGGGHMAGGGTQGFVSKFPDGTYRFLPFDFIRHESVWFCNTGSRATKGWTPITPDMYLADCGDWPPTRVLGDEPRYANCQSCHGSQIAITYDTIAKRYDTRFTTLAVNCESCHGPGRRHVELMRAGTRSADIGMTALATLKKDSAMTVCFQCHALKDQLARDYVPGESLERYYSLKLPQLGDAPFQPDGRVRTFAYQQGHLYSDCYLNGSLSCTDCHDPHSQTYRDHTGAPLEGRLSNGQCTSCHPSKAEAIEVHTKHAATSPGSQCVACHMPYLQQPELGRAVRYARSDHSIPIPRPAFDASEEIESACKSCHANQTEAQLDADVRRLWGALKPQHPTVDALVRARRETDRAKAARLAIEPASHHAYALFSGLAYFLDHFLRPDMPELERDVVERLERAAESADPDVRAIALASVHYARGEDNDVRRVLAKQLWTFGDQDLPLRRRWAVVLGYLADKHRAAGEHVEAIATYRKALEIVPQDARVLLNLGLTYADAGEYARAVDSYAQSLRVDPIQPLAFVNLGIALAEQNDLQRAVVAYRQAIAVNPNEPLAYFNLANAYLKGNDPASAIPFYEHAIALDPSIALAHFYLAQAYAQRGDFRKAMAAVDFGLEFDRSNADALRLRGQLASMVADSTRRGAAPR